MRDVGSSNGSHSARRALWLRLCCAMLCAVWCRAMPGCCADLRGRHETVFATVCSVDEHEQYVACVGSLLANARSARTSGSAYDRLGVCPRRSVFLGVAARARCL